MSAVRFAPRFVVAGPLVCAALLLPLPALAQIQEIVVTARKKEESLQDVPISVSAFGEEQLRGLGLQSDSDVADFTVNFNTLAQVGRDLDRPVIRGMSSPASRGEANAGYFIDGIYVSGSIATATTSAVERVEILRGPQATQFGRATFAGAINYVTKKPTEELEGAITTRAGTHDDYLVGGWTSGTLIEDRLGFLVSAAWSKYGGQWHNSLEQGEAFGQPTIYNPVNPPQQADSSRLGNEETQDYLVKLVWQAWEGAEFDFKYGYSEADDGTFASFVAPAAQPLDALPPGDPRRGLADQHGGPVGIFNTLNCWLPPTSDGYLPEAPVPGEQPWWRTTGGSFCGEFTLDGWENRANLPDFSSGVNSGAGLVGPVEPGLRKRQNRYFLQFNQDLDDWLLTARYGRNTEDFDNVFDLDHTETRAVFGLFGFEIDRESEDWSGELRLASPRDLPVRGEIGSYYYDASRDSNQRSFLGPTVYFSGDPNDAWSVRRADKQTENLAFFGSFGWDFAEQWTLDVEARYASEEISFIGGNGCSTSDTYYNLTPRVSVTYKPTDELRLYVQVANGDKPGDVNNEYFRGDVRQDFCEEALAETSDVVVQPEEQWTYEVGVKSRWFDNRLQANLAVFYIDWDQQSIFQTVNFAAYPFSTADDTLVTTILRNVGTSRNLGGELETLFQVTDELTLIANYGYTHAKFEDGFDANLFDLTGDGDVSGQWIPSTPEHNGVLGLVLTKPINEVSTFTFRTDVAYESKRYVGTSNLNWLGERTLVNLRAGVQNGPWDVTFYVRNLMDDQTPTAALNFVNFGYGAIAPGSDGLYGPLGVTAGADDIYPNMWSLNPQRGRDYGLEVSYRFGAE